MGVENRGRRKKNTVQRILNSEAVWQFISIILSYFSLSAMKQVFNGHYTIELRQSKAHEANRIEMLPFLSVNFPTP